MSRSGFVGLAGRPNVGKSTLVNAIVGSHVVIVSNRPQTTRRAIRGVATDLDSETQLVLVDLPGVQRPRDRVDQGRLADVGPPGEADEARPRHPSPAITPACSSSISPSSVSWS